MDGELRFLKALPFCVNCERNLRKLLQNAEKGVSTIECVCVCEYVVVGLLKFSGF